MDGSMDNGDASFLNQQLKANKKMVWTEDHELMFCREVILHELYQYKDGSRERGQCLDRIAESLNSVTTVWFKVDQRSLRDKLKKLLQQFVKKKNEEEKSSGISPEHTEIDDVLLEIYEQKKEAELAAQEQSAAKSKTNQEEKEVAEDMRKISMERLSETRKRDTQDLDGSMEKKRRSSGGDTIAFLREKSERDFQLKEEELKLRREELELNKAREKAQVEQSQAMFTLINKLADKF